jgi:hypothetical protein
MASSNSQRRQLAWYRVPVVWLGILILAGSIAGSVWIIVVSVQYRDHALDVPVHSVLGVPAHADPPPAASSSP